LRVGASSSLPTLNRRAPRTLTMKTPFVFALTAAASVSGLSIPWGATSGSQVTIENPDFSLDNVPAGFNIDLDALRLVQFAPDEKPVWITEREKVCMPHALDMVPYPSPLHNQIQARAGGKFFDM
jgi:hypothetical protein